MNKKFLKYLISSPEPVLRFWLRMYEKRGRGETYVISSQELQVMFNMNEEALNKILFNSDLLKCISVQEEAGLFTMNFKGPDKKKKDEPHTQLMLHKNEGDQSLVANVTNFSSHYLDVTLVETSGPKKEYVFDTQTRKCVIGDYCQWLMDRQVNAGMLVGNFDVKPIKPTIRDIDVKFLRLISGHMFSSGAKTKGSVIRSIRKIYTYWEKFPPNIEKYIQPQQIYSNMNSIIDLLIRGDIQPKTKQEKTDERFSKEITEARERDYSHLVKGGKGNN